MFQLTVIETTRTVVLVYNETGDSFYTLPVVPWNTQEICYIHVRTPPRHVRHVLPHGRAALHPRASMNGWSVARAAAAIAPHRTP